MFLQNIFSALFLVGERQLHVEKDICREKSGDRPNLIRHTVLMIRIPRIRMFLGLPDPWSEVQMRIRLLMLPFSHKGAERTEILLAK
jgi:hypothetical protein